MSDREIDFARQTLESIRKCQQTSDSLNKLFYPFAFVRKLSETTLFCQLASDNKKLNITNVSVNLLSFTRVESLFMVFLHHIYFSI